MCDVNMVDSALERPDVALFKYGTIGLNRVHLRNVVSLFTHPRYENFTYLKILRVVGQMKGNRSIITNHALS